MSLERVIGEELWLKGARLSASDCEARAIVGCLKCKADGFRNTCVLSEA